MRESDTGYIVVDQPRRNSSMQEFIESLKASGTPRIHQLIDVTMDNGAGPSFWHNGVPVGSLACLLVELEEGAIHSVKNYGPCSSAATILAAQTRRADLQGPDLQRVHVEVGKFLADRLIEAFPFTDLITTKQYAHVQGSMFDGPSTAGGENVRILPLMRGGEPMSRDVHQRFPEAQLVHFTSDGSNVWLSHKILMPAADEKQKNLIIVDSVINRGNSIREVLNQLGADDAPYWNIFVLAGVMQLGAAQTLPKEFPRVRFLTLRVSDNHYTGKGGTDTGNRLFGTLAHDEELH
jgi:uracil phosphoribosyltransferase